jgi:hypothetical protein
MMRFALIVLLVVLAVGCGTAPRPSSSAPENLWICFDYPLEVTFEACKAACEEVGAEIVSSEIHQSEARIVAHRLVGDDSHIYEIHLQPLHEEVDDAWAIVLYITLGDTSKMINHKDPEYAEYGAALGRQPLEK